MARSQVKKHSWTPDQESAVVDMHRKLKCGPARLARALPEIDRHLLFAMFARLKLASANYHVWTDDEEARLIRLQTTTGHGSKRLATEFPGVDAASISSSYGLASTKSFNPNGWTPSEVELLSGASTPYQRLSFHSTNPATFTIHQSNVEPSN